MLTINHLVGFGFESPVAVTALTYAYWRILATSSSPVATNNAWNVYEMAMMENPASSSSLTSGGTPLSGGDYTGGFGASNAFDGSTGSRWFSAQIGTAINGAAWIGYRFSTACALRRIDINQGPAGSTSNMVDTVAIQCSTDGSAWTTVLATPLSTAGGTVTITW